LQRIKDAVNAIVAVHKNDYKLEDTGNNSMRLSCRTGYSWGTIAEFIWDSAAEDQLEMSIECKPNAEVFLTHQLQKEYQEKYLSNLHDLFIKYMDKLPVVRKEPNVYKISFKKRLGIILSTAFITVIVVLIILNSTE